MAHGHENAKAIEALAELITRYADKSGQPLTTEQATIAARAVAANFDLAGKGTLKAFKQWVKDMIAAGDYMDVGGPDNQAQNCASEICC